MAGLYIHIPFCKQACYYCDFHFSISLKKKDELLQALQHELVLRCSELKNSTIETIYFGGGTPSLLKNQDLQEIIDLIHENYLVCKHPEITLEANPDDLSEERIIQLYNSPINRLSIGIQSFFDQDLKSMNRVHSSAEANVCLEVAKKYFDNITIDLIYGMPGLSNTRWKENLNNAFYYGINHISSYALTVEPKTAWAKFVKQGHYKDVDELQLRQQFEILVEETDKKGFIHYEISNFGQEGYFSKHNSAYWKGKSYVGIGPSAHSFNGRQRSWNVANNSKYISAIQKDQLPNELEILSQNDRFNEKIMTGLRTIWGVNLIDIENNFGKIYVTELINNAKKFISKELLELSESKLKTTLKGKFLVDGIAAELFMI